MRKKNSVLNIIGTIGAYGISVIFNFITQAIFIRTLGIEYLGLNGLFSNILTMLSVAELGIGSAIIFKLYEPIANKDNEKIKSWMKFYKYCYNTIAIIILIVGLSLIPFLKIIVGEVSISENIVILYIIQILDTVFSYLITYKRSLLYADQKNYIINAVHIGYLFFMNITQILILMIMKNYVVYLVVKVLYRILENVVINIIVNKKYPFIKQKSKNIEKEEIKDIVQRVKSIFLQKVSFVINKGIDNIVISYFLGVTAVGYYTNYYTIIAAISSVIYQIVSSFTASVGNLLVEKNYEKNFYIYKKINMLNSFITGISICIFCTVITPFIKVWIGEKYLLGYGTIITFAIYLYSDSIRRSITLFKDAAGICKEDKYMYVIMATINLALSIILCKRLGMIGVILGTAISYIFLIIYSYPKYIWPKVFRKEKNIYYLENGKYLLFIIASTLISMLICSKMNITNLIIQIILKFLIAFIVTGGIFYSMFYKTKELKEVQSKIKKIL